MSNPTTHPADVSPEPFAAFAIADAVLSSGLHGLELSKHLLSRFPHAKRADAFLALAIVAIDFAAATLERELEFQVERDHPTGSRLSR